MINHVRTLLLNIDGTAVSGYDIAHEYVPADYKAVTLPTVLRTVRNELFGFGADRAGLNYMLRHYTPILHAPEIEHMTLARDSRVTYWPDQQSIFSVTHRPHVSVPSGRAHVNFAIDEGATDALSGRLEYNWNVHIVNAVDYNAAANSIYDVYVPREWFLNQLSEPINIPLLPGIKMLITGEAYAGEVWTGTLIKRPFINVATVPDRIKELMTSTIASALFGDGLNAELNIYRDWWYDSNQLHFQLAGVLLALAYQTDALR